MRDTSFRLVLNAHESEFERARDSLFRWNQARWSWGENKPPLCVFVSSSREGASDHLGPWSLLDVDCLHEIQVPKEIDNYSRGVLLHPGKSSWGRKSGPNWQFFEVMTQLNQIHTEQWSLLLEWDTYPVERNLRDALTKTLEEVSESVWMVGGRNHPDVLDGLDPRFHGHKNGVALYRTGSTEFSDFVRAVWAPSLIELARREPGIAFDVLTSPDVWPSLGRALRNQWEAHAEAFQASDLILNRSTLSTTHHPWTGLWERTLGVIHSKP